MKNFLALRLQGFSKERKAHDKELGLPLLQNYNNQA